MNHKSAKDIVHAIMGSDDPITIKEREACATNLVEIVSCSSYTYKTAHKKFTEIGDVFHEAASHLEHNARIEFGPQQIEFLLDKY